MVVTPTPITTQVCDSMDLKIQIISYKTIEYRDDFFLGGGDGGKSSTYYNTGSGHSFYKGTNGVSFHENSNQGKHQNHSTRG